MSCNIPVFASWGIRFVSVNGYLAFYIISEEDNLVYCIIDIQRNIAGLSNRFMVY